MISDSQIREQAKKFLDQEIDLDTLEDWMVRNTWNIHQTGNEAAEQITFAIEESLAEHSSNHISDQQLREELRRLIEPARQPLALQESGKADRV